MRKNTTASADLINKAVVKDGDILHLLHRDHATVDELFFQFSQSENEQEKARISKTILEELAVHLKAEEDAVYTQVRKEVDEIDDKVDESDTEHHTAKLLIEELSSMEPDEDYFEAKMTVLSEVIKHHVQEEEKEMFKKIAESGMDLEELAEEFRSRKEALKKGGLRKLAAQAESNSKEEG